jgi:DtxR family Mn-dependent transcriptional regulator
MSEMQTLSEENHLKAIYKLGGGGAAEKVSLKAIAEVLNNNPASVVDMIRKLSDKELVLYDKSKGVRLTEKGNRSALMVVRRHRLWEVFLLEKLGYRWEQIHDIAEQLEHIHDPELADRLDKFLGFPKYDPHGDPIPMANGELPAVSDIILDQFPDKTECQVVGVKDTSIPFLQYLRQLSVGIGTRICIDERIAYDGSLSISIDGGVKTTVSKKFAENIWVKHPGKN